MNKHVDIALSREFSSLVRNNHLEEACQYLLDNIDSYQQRETVYFYVARIKFKAKKNEEALKFLEKIEDCYRYSYRYWYMRGLCAYRANHYESARTSFKEAVEISEPSEKTIARYAISAYKTGYFELAFLLFSSIEDYTNNHYILTYYRSFSEALFNGNYTEFSQDFDWSEQIIVNGIVKCRKQNQTFEANFLINLLLEAPRSAFDQSYFQRVDKHHFNIKTEGFREYVTFFNPFQDEQKQFPPGLQIIIAEILFSLNFHKEAAPLYSKFMQLRQLNDTQLQRAFSCFTKINDYENSLKACSNLALLSSAKSKAYFILAKEQKKLGNTERSLKCLTLHLNNSPRDILAILWLAEFAINQNNQNYAEKQLVKAQYLNKKSKKLIRLIKLFEKTFGRRIQPSSTHADYSYIDWSQISVPNEFQLDRNAVNQIQNKTMWIKVLETFSIVLSALMLREMTTRFGRNGLGYLWVVIRQIVFIGFFVLLFDIRGRHLPYGVSTLAFLITGINSFFIFRNTVTQIKTALKANTNLLYYRQISPFSIYASRAILETLTGIFIFAILCATLIISGEQIKMSSLLQVLTTLLLLGAFGACYGLLIATVSTFIPAISSFETVMGRVLFFTSGVFFYANELPTEVREILMWNPLFHLIELLREAFFDTYTANYASLGYVFGWLITFFFFSLILERVGRKRILET